MVTGLKFKSGCSHFLGYIPCKPHKEYGVHCDDCNYYEPKKGKILIIKLGAIGDVIRTTPLLHKIKKEHPDHEVWWLTYSPEIIPKQANKVFDFNLESIITLENTRFDILINLDKDNQACALAKKIEAGRKFGFILEEGKPAPVNKLSEHKFLTGLFDDVNQANTKSYLREIFEISGWEFNGEEYILEKEDFEWSIPSDGKKIVGLNTGCGSRWVTRLWAEANWERIIMRLLDAGYFPMLLGGSQEHEKNTRLSEKTGAYYPGHFSLGKFISLVDQCNLIVSAVTLGMHIAIGLKKPLILMNNIFNPHEFELYGRGEIIQPERECKCFFRQTCTNDEYFCMDHLSPETIFEAIQRHLQV